MRKLQVVRNTTIASTVNVWGTAACYRFLQWSGISRRGKLKNHDVDKNISLDERRFWDIKRNKCNIEFTQYQTCKALLGCVSKAASASKRHRNAPVISTLSTRRSGTGKKESKQLLPRLSPAATSRHYHFVALAKSKQCIPFFMSSLRAPRHTHTH